MLLAEGVPIATVSKPLGHTRVSTTLDYYAHVLPESRGTVGARFDERLRSYGSARPGGDMVLRSGLDALASVSKRLSAPMKKARQDSIPTGFPNVPRGRIELPTPGFSVLTIGTGSTAPDWAETALRQRFWPDPVSTVDHRRPPPTGLIGSP